MAENQFEEAVIKKLTQEGWDYRKDLSGVNISVLENHWRGILNRNNSSKLEGTLLSDSEFDMVMLEIAKNKSPYQSQLMLSGAGGVGTVPLTRDDGTQLELEIFYEDEVAGGRSQYEIVNQITFNELKDSLGNNRRIDILMLINGLPVAHIEEKDEALQSQWRAFEQLKKYDSDGMYTDLMSFVQVQFILSQHSAHYFARPRGPEFYNKDFVFGWRDEQGKDITNTMEFIHQVMGIPALHRLVTVNMIPDADNDNVMVMRSYQIQATREILSRMKTMDENHFIEKEGGYIWHTTGSGKTVTSFKVAQLIASMPRVRNVIFIVDRVDLIKQTHDNFKSYAYEQFKNRIKIVKGHTLKRELKSKNAASNIFLITVQGLHRAIKSGLKSNDRMVIIMDEAHRSASGDAVKDIKEGLPKTTWFGFTGTPNFYSDESKGVKTTRNASTHDIFGKQLHRYTIKDAIGDGNVLGFDITYYEPEIVKNADTDLTEDEIEREVYNSLQYRESVVEDIVTNWHDNADGPVTSGQREPNKFQAMFAVSGKQAAASYYALFKKMSPDLRVAMTYSNDETNGEGKTDTQIALKQAIKDYELMFDTRDFFETDDPTRNYLNDITKRLARKGNYNRGQEKDRLDLIIVSDQLLTGFDSKYVNIIYMDKTLKEGLLIQAMSRTNRTFDKNAKPYGKVRFYRRGTVMEENVQQALVIYTRGGSESSDDPVIVSPVDYPPIIAPKPAIEINEINPILKRLKEIAGDNFSQIPKSEKERKEFVELANQVNNQIKQLLQGEYKIGEEVANYDILGQDTGETVRLDLDSMDDFSALEARLNDVNKLLPPNEKVDLGALSVSIRKHSKEIVDYDHLVDLLNMYIDQTTETNRKAIEDHIAPMDDDSRKDINIIIDEITSGEHTRHFSTESLDERRTLIHSERKELKIRRWADARRHDANEIIRAYDLYRPGITLNDNPELRSKIEEIQDSSNMGFFEKGTFEQEIISLFDSL